MPRGVTRATRDRRTMRRRHHRRRKRDDRPSRGSLWARRASRKSASELPAAGQRPLDGSKVHDWGLPFGKIPCGAECLQLAVKSRAHGRRHRSSARLWPETLHLPCGVGLRSMSMFSCESRYQVRRASWHQPHGDIMNGESGTCSCSEYCANQRRCNGFRKARCCNVFSCRCRGVSFRMAAVAVGECRLLSEPWISIKSRILTSRY